MNRTRLWREGTGISAALERTLREARGFQEVADFLTTGNVRRVVATGNGAALYVAHAIWLASLEHDGAFEVVTVPAGVLASGRFRWRRHDRLFVVSSSGELRDAIQALEAGAPRPYAVLTANEDSTLGGGARFVALVHVQEQETETHSQAYCGNLAAAFSIWARMTGDEQLTQSLADAPATMARLIDEAEGWAPRAADSARQPVAAIAFGSGAGWPAALEAALLLKEVAGIPAEGLETREGATSGMYALGPRKLALSLPSAGPDELEEAEDVCRRTGATVFRMPGGQALDPRLAGLGAFPASLALAIELGLRAGLDVDRPAWAATYYDTARLNE